MQEKSQQVAIVIAHGSKKIGWNQTALNVLEKLKLCYSQVQWELAYLESLEPSLDNMILKISCELRYKKVYLLPLLLGSGTHIHQDITKAVQKLNTLRSDIAVVTSEPLGSSEVVCDALAAAAYHAVQDH